MSVRIVREEKPYRLICGGHGRYAVLEARCGHVYSLHCDHPRHEALDTPAGMESAVGNAWRDYDRALRRFDAMVEAEERYSRTLW